MEERENKKLGTILNYAIIVCIAAILIMIICGIVGKFLDKKTNRIGEFSERHPRLNMVIALALVVIMGTAGYVSIYYIVCKVKEIIHWIADMRSLPSVSFCSSRPRTAPAPASDNGSPRYADQIMEHFHDEGSRYFEAGSSGML